MTYTIFETHQFLKDLVTLAESGEKHISDKLRTFVYPQLREHPQFGIHTRKLKGFKPDTWRYRIGAWRFFYEIDEAEKIVFMLAASHRSRAY